MLPLPALIFCTCYADSPVVWESRYRRWINAIKRSSLTWWQILIVDDGSPCVPDWPDATFVDEGASIPPDAELVVYRFKQRLGRSGIRNYPGWYRSFCFAGRYARAAGIEKVIHLESDAFLISNRIQEAFDSFREGWATVYVERYSMPESAIQVIAGSAIETLSAFCQIPYEARLDLTIENEIPFTNVFKEFRGGRYGETLDYIPSDAEWAVQVFPPMRDVDAYYWWLKDAINIPTNLPRSQTVIESYALAPDESGKIVHAGVDYRTIMSEQQPEARNLYIDLLIKCIAGIIYRDPSILGGSKGTFDPGVRHTGGDWPLLAHSMVGTLRLENVRTLVETVLRDKIPGDLIETGVWRGGSCILMRGILRAYGVEDRKVYACDSYKGLPAPNLDVYPEDRNLDLSDRTELSISRDEVANNFRAYGLLDAQVVFVEGWFKDTLPQLTTQQFSLLRLDGDMYESTIQALDALYPRLSPGGFVIIDDYGGLEECRKAVQDYRTAHAIIEPIHEIDWTGRWWQKSR